MFDQSYGIYIMPLVIHSLRGEHTHTHTHTSKHTPTHIDIRGQKQFQETRHTPACGRHAPGLKIINILLAMMSQLLMHYSHCRSDKMVGFDNWLPTKYLWLRLLQHPFTLWNCMPLHYYLYNLLFYRYFSWQYIYLLAFLFGKLVTYTTVL